LYRGICFPSLKVNCRIYSLITLLITLLKSAYIQYQKFYINSSEKSVKFRYSLRNTRNN